MNNIFVTDTDSIVSYFHEVFDVRQILTKRALRIIEQAFMTYPSGIKLSIPSVVFIEIFNKWFRKEETARKIRYEFYELVQKSPNIEIKPIEQEVLENLILIEDELSSHDMHDKIILASAIMLNCPIITTDRKIISYLKKHKVIPYIR